MARSADCTEARLPHPTHPLPCPAPSPEPSCSPGPPGDLKDRQETAGQAAELSWRTTSARPTGHRGNAPDRRSGHLPSGHPDRPPSQWAGTHRTAGPHTLMWNSCLSVLDPVKSFFFVRGVKSKNPKEEPKAPQAGQTVGCSRAGPARQHGDIAARGPEPPPPPHSPPSCNVHPTA